MTDTMFFVEKINAATPVLSGRTSQRYLSDLRDKLKDSKAAFYVVLGVGDGAVVRTLLDKDDGSIVILVEQNWNYLAWCNQNAGLEAMIATGRLYLIDTLDPKAAMGILSIANDKLMQGGIVLPPSVYSQLDFNDKFLKSIFIPHIINVKSNYTTCLSNSRVTGDNMLRNALSYSRSYSIGLLEGLLEYERPVILVNAGPSIEENLPLLKRLHDEEQIPIISCLTMLKPLLMHGIVPDFVTALDYHSISARFFEGIDWGIAKELCYVIEPKVNPAVVEALNAHGARYIFQNANPWLNAFIESVPYAVRDYHITEGNTVAHMSYILATVLHPSHIIMLGEDLSFPGDQYYPACVYEAHPWKRYSIAKMAGRPLIQMEDAEGKPLLTDDQMLGYHARLEELLGGHDSSIPLFVCGRGLPFSKELKLMRCDLIEAARQLTNKHKDRTYMTVLCEKMSSMTCADKDLVVDALSEMRGKFSKLYNQWTSGIQLYEKMGGADKIERGEFKLEGEAISKEIARYFDIIPLVESYAGTVVVGRDRLDDGIAKEDKTERKFELTFERDLRLMRDVRHKTGLLIKTLEDIVRDYLEEKDSRQRLDFSALGGFSQDIHTGG